MSDLVELFSALAMREDRTHVRFRFPGKLWHLHFMQVMQVSGGSVIFRDVSTDRVILLFESGLIAQFEPDGSLYPYDPNFYDDVGSCPQV